MAKKIKVEVTKSLWGKFNLPYNVGQEVEMESKLAEELIKSKHAVAVSAQQLTPEQIKEKELKAKAKTLKISLKGDDGKAKSMEDLEKEINAAEAANK